MDDNHLSSAYHLIVTLLRTQKGTYQLHSNEQYHFRASSPLIYSPELLQKQQEITSDLVKLEKLTLHAQYLAKMLAHLSVESLQYQFFQLQEALRLWADLMERVHNVQMISLMLLWDKAGDQDALVLSKTVDKWVLELDKSFEVFVDFFAASDEHLKALFFQSPGVQYLSWIIHQRTNHPPFGKQRPHDRLWRLLFWRWYNKLEITVHAENTCMVGMGALIALFQRTSFSLRPLLWQKVIDQLRPHQEMVIAINEALTSTADHSDVSEDLLPLWAYHQGISLQSIEALITTTYAQREGAQKICQQLAAQILTAQQIGVGNWHLLGLYAAPEPLPSSQELSFSHSLEIIGKIFAPFGDDFAKFAKLLVEQGQIRLEIVAAGENSVTVYPMLSPLRPMLFCRYDGQVNSLLDLAAGWMEAFYYWLNRDQPWVTVRLSRLQRQILIEFAHQLVMGEAASLLPPEHQTSLRTKQSISRVEVLLATGARYELEQKMRALDQGASICDVPQMIVEMHQRWYGEQLAPGEVLSLFWAQQLWCPLALGPFAALEKLLGALLAADWVGQYQSKGKVHFISQWRQYLHSAGQVGPEDLFQRFFKKRLSGPEFWVTACGQFRGLENN